MKSRRSLAALLLAVPGAAAAQTASSTIPEVLVTSAREAQPVLEAAQSVTRIDAGQIIDRGAAHYSQIINTAPGAYIQRGSGQEGLIALRSPVLSGAGACGAFLLMEDGAPLRPPGFCNLNDLFEVNTEQAQAIEVLRGPASALYGPNALHGGVQVFGPDPAELPGMFGSLEAGSAEFIRAKVAAKSSDDFGGYFLVSHDGGFREHSAVDEQKGNLRFLNRNDRGELRANLAFTHLDQDTAGFVQGFDSYRDDALRFGNANPEAYRKASSVRANVAWQQELEPGRAFEARAILRWSDMDFLQHFLLGEPQERNGQRSLGLQSKWTASGGDWRVDAGGDADIARTYLIEFQQNPTTGGTPGARAIRPAGYHYDYTIASLGAGAYARVEWRPQPRWLATFEARDDYIEYRYDNHMLAGNTDQNGIPCGAGGCLYSRPADRSDSFNVLSPQVSLLYRLADTESLYVTANRGFRPPESTELYRLQRQQSIADLKPERLDMIELGWRHASSALDVSAAAYYGNKKNFIFRDSVGFNVSNGKTRHRGVELALDWRANELWRINAAASIATHTYEFSRSADQGEQIVAGNDVDTAPHRLGSLSLERRFGTGVRADLSWTFVGPYFADAANTARYPGHNIGDLRLAWQVTPRWSAQARVDNLLDRAYADRADFAFGNYRYFPGRPRSYFFELGYRAP